MQTPITILKQLGCKVVDRELTAGARKWWLTWPRDRKTRSLKILKALGIDSDTRTSPHAFEYRGDGFTITFQTKSQDGHDGIFIAKPRRNRKGREYQHGIDC